MPSITERADEMRESLAGILNSTGEFPIVEPAYKFSGLPGLGSNRNRNIYCVMDSHIVPQGQTGKYIIILHPDESISRQEIRQKLREATAQGIYTIHVLYRYVNSKSDTSSQGPLFRRFVLDDERAEGPVAYRHRATYSRDSLQHYPAERRNNFRRTRKIEREFVPSVSGQAVLYFQPKSRSLPEAVKRYEWGNVTYRGKGAFGEPRIESSVTDKEPVLIEEFSSFTLTPIVRFPYSRNFLIGDMVGLPQVQAHSLEERVIRRNLGLLEHLKNFGLGDSVDEMAERLAIQLESFPESSPLSSYLEVLLQKHEPQTGTTAGAADGHSNDVRTIKIPSRSKPGQVHIIRERMGPNPKELMYDCSCLGFGYRGKCGHIDELVESQNVLI